MCYQLYAEIRKWPSKQELEKLLSIAGLAISIGKYSIRIDNFKHFEFTELGNDLGEPQIEASWTNRKEMLEQSLRISNILKSAKIQHRFEIYNDADELDTYLHFNWQK